MAEFIVKYKNKPIGVIFAYDYKEALWQAKQTAKKKGLLNSYISVNKKYDNRPYNTKIHWRQPKPNEIVEWWTPEDFVRITHGRDVRNVAIDAPNYGDDELGTRPTYEMPERLAKAENVDLLKAIHSPEPNKSVNDGRHRAYAAYSLGDERVPVVVGYKE